MSRPHSIYSGVQQCTACTRVRDREREERSSHRLSTLDDHVAILEPYSRLADNLTLIPSNLSPTLECGSKKIGPKILKKKNETVAAVKTPLPKS